MDPSTLSSFMHPEWNFVGHFPSSQADRLPSPCSLNSPSSFFQAYPSSSASHDPSSSSASHEAASSSTCHEAASPCT